MATLLFVHGTGVSKTAFESMLETVKARVSAHIPSLDVKACFWGEKYGAKLHHGGASIPRYADTRGVTEVEPIDEQIAAWA